MPGRTAHAAAAPLVSLLACLGALASPVAAFAHDGGAPRLIQLNHPPTGAITLAPAAPHTGDVVTFAAGSSDRDGDAVTTAWDLDGDGRFETTGPTATHTWTTSGPEAVRVRLTDARGATTILRKAFDVLNSPPVGPFTVAPGAPLGGEDIAMTSQASDPDGGTLQLQQSWDLNGDGVFGDATGPIAHVSFPAGEHVVRLQVTDGQGAATVTEQTILVAAPTPITAADASNARSLSPFPIVRLSGRITSRGVRVSRLTVLGPRGARIAVRCRGGGCPRRVLRRVVPAKGPRLVRVRVLRHTLRPGARVEIRVTKPGFTGKYTRFLVRSHGAPRRSDRCLPPGATTPKECR
jgi:hypothetical protein